MTAKDAAFVMLFVLFVLSVIGNIFLTPYYIGADQAEKNLEQQIDSLETEKSVLQRQHQGEIADLEDDNESLQQEVEQLENELNLLQYELDQLYKDLESKTGTTASYESLITSLRTRIYELESEVLQIQNDLNQCRAQKSYYSCPSCCDYYYCHSRCSSCYSCCGYSCYRSVSVSNSPGVFGGQPFDAIIYVYYDYPCRVLRIYVDILDVNTIQVVGVDWD
ncbi:MAG: hypothetical protein PVF58_19885 [Candidatus Methanofastidiosia archaeon]|jgi:cell division protein FtsB